MLRSCLWVCALLWCMPAFAKSKKIVMINDVYEPFVMDPARKPNIGPGIDMEIATIALKRAGYEVEFRLEPWARVLALLEKGKADMTTTLSFKPERDKYLLWSAPYRTDAKYNLIVKKNGKHKPGSIADLKGLRVGGVKKYYYPEDITKNKELDFDQSAPSIEKAAKMMLNDKPRYDIIIANSTQGLWALKEAGLLEQVEFRDVLFATRPDEEKLKATYMGFAKERKLEDVVKAFDMQINKMKDSGEIDSITQKYLSE